MAQIIIILVVFLVYLLIRNINKKVDKKIKEDSINIDPKHKTINRFWNIITWLVLIFAGLFLTFYIGLIIFVSTLPKNASW